MKPVIICGGVGTKMWPLSSPEMPKQFLPLISEKSLFQITYEQLLEKYKPEEIFVSTNITQKELIAHIAPEIPQHNYILETEMRNTGPAIGLIAAMLYRLDPDEPFVICQSDVLRQPTEAFLQMILDFESLTKKTGKWVTPGFKPEFAMTGVDYMISGNKVDGAMELAEWLMGTDKESIEGYVKNGQAWLHANHYCWTPKKWLESYQKFKPEWATPLWKIAKGGDEKTIYPTIPAGRTEDWTKLSVAAGEGMMVELPFKWWDFGTWESVSVYTGDENKNKIEIEAKNNYVRSMENKPVAVIGLSDIIVIDGPKGLLVCKKSESGRVGEVVKKLN